MKPRTKLLCITPATAKVIRYVAGKRTDKAEIEGGLTAALIPELNRFLEVGHSHPTGEKAA